MIKKFSFVIVAAALMSIAAASAAQAGEFHAEGSGSVAITGEQTQPISLQYTSPTGPSTKCTQALFEGTVQGQGGAQSTAQELTLTLTLTGCTSFGMAGTVDMNGCKLTVTANQGGAGTAQLDVAGCTAGQSIVVTSAGCTVTVPEQTEIGHVTAANNAGPPKDIEITMTLQNVKYELHGALCAHTTTVVTQDGSLGGQATFKAFEDLGSQQATHNGHQYNKIVDGNQIGLYVT